MRPAPSTTRSLLEARDEASDRLGRELTDAEWEAALPPATQKLERIISRFGDEGGERRKPYYLGALVQEYIIQAIMIAFLSQTQKKTASEEDDLPTTTHYTIPIHHCQSRKEARL